MKNKTKKQKSSAFQIKAKKNFTKYAKNANMTYFLM